MHPNTPHPDPQSQPTLAIVNHGTAGGVVARTLRHAGIPHVVAFPSIAEFEAFACNHPCSLAILDTVAIQDRMAGVLASLQALQPRMAVLVLCDGSERREPLLAPNGSTCEFLPKPVELNELVTRVQAKLQEIRHPATIRHDEDDEDDAFAQIVTQNQRMREIFRYLKAVAKSPEPLLITGETGTGKDLIAQALHRLSKVNGEFVAVNVAGFDDTMFADSLFGHRKGAFTGANEPRPGLILRASSGTLFLDEIGDLSVPSQVKLLRLLQEREYFPLGSDLPKYTTARIVCATSQDLKKMQQAGSFRKDLYYRLCTHHVHLPPLRERPEDIELLCRHFIDEAERSMDRPVPQIPAELISIVKAHHFPGNVREMRALIYDIVSCSPIDEISMPYARKAINHGRTMVTPLPTNQMIYPSRLPTLRQAQEQLMAEALRRTGNNQALAAKLLGITRQALNKRVRKEAVESQKQA